VIYALETLWEKRRVTHSGVDTTPWNEEQQVFTWDREQNSKRRKGDDEWRKLMIGIAPDQASQIRKSGALAMDPRSIIVTEGPSSLKSPIKVDLLSTQGGTVGMNGRPKHLKMAEVRLQRQRHCGPSCGCYS
jgi:hypothetical protein